MTEYEDLKYGYAMACLRERSGDRELSGADWDFIDGRCSLFMEKVETPSGMPGKFWRFLGEDLCVRDGEFFPPGHDFEKGCADFGMPENYIESLDREVSDFCLECLIPGKIRMAVFGRDPAEGLEAMKSSYASILLFEKRDLDGEDILSEGDRAFIDRRCRLFMEKMNQAGIGDDWNNEMWATAGDVLCDRDGGFSLGGRDFGDDGDEHGFSESEAEKADVFLRKFLECNPVSEADYEQVFASLDERLSL